MNATNGYDFSSHRQSSTDSPSYRQREEGEYEDLFRSSPLELLAASFNDEPSYTDNRHSLDKNMDHRRSKDIDNRINMEKESATAGNESGPNRVAETGKDREGLSDLDTLMGEFNHLMTQLQENAPDSPPRPTPTSVHSSPNASSSPNRSQLRSSSSSPLPPFPSSTSPRRSFSSSPAPSSLSPPREYSSAFPSDVPSSSKKKGEAKNFNDSTERMDRNIPHSNLNSDNNHLSNNNNYNNGDSSGINNYNSTSNNITNSGDDNQMRKHHKHNNNDNYDSLRRDSLEFLSSLGRTLSEEDENVPGNVLRNGFLHNRNDSDHSTHLLAEKVPKRVPSHSSPGRNILSYRDEGDRNIPSDQRERTPDRNVPPYRHALSIPFSTTPEKHVPRSRHHNPHTTPHTVLSFSDNTGNRNHYTDSSDGRDDRRDARRDDKNTRTAFDENGRTAFDENGRTTFDENGRTAFERLSGSNGGRNERERNEGERNKGGERNRGSEHDYYDYSNNVILGTNAGAASNGIRNDKNDRNKKSSRDNINHDVSSISDEASHRNNEETEMNTFRNRHSRVTPSPPPDSGLGFRSVLEYPRGPSLTADEMRIIKRIESEKEEKKEQENGEEKEEGRQRTKSSPVLASEPLESENSSSLLPSSELVNDRLAYERLQHTNEKLLEALEGERRVREGMGRRLEDHNEEVSA